MPRVSLAYFAGGFRGPSTQRWAIADLSGSGCSQLAHRNFTRPPGSCASATGCIASPQTGQALLPLSKLRTHPCRWGCSSALRTLQVNLSTAERRLAATLRLRVLKKFYRPCPQRSMGAGSFWWQRQRGFAPGGPAGPFHIAPTGAFRHRSPKAAKIVGLSVGLFLSRATIVEQLQLLAPIVRVLSWHHFAHCPVLPPKQPRGSQARQDRVES